MRKRLLSSIIAVGLLSSGVLTAEADLAPAPSAFAPPAMQKPQADLSWNGVGELNRRSAEHLAQNPTYLGADGEVITVERVAVFLDRKNSPLADHARDFVEAGLAHGVDPRSVIAIAGIESSFGKRQRGHNAWGWSGGPGGSLSRWENWSTAIWAYTEKLGTKYDTENIDVAFAKRYVPPNWEKWLRAVNQFTAEI